MIKRRKKLPKVNFTYLQMFSCYYPHRPKSPKTVLILIFVISVLFILYFRFITKDVPDANADTNTNKIVTSERESYHKTNYFDNFGSYDNKDNENDDPIWTRISDSVHIYSAHLDTRQRSPTTPFKTLNNLTLIRLIGIKRFRPMREIIKQDPFKWLRIKDETYFGDEYYCKIFILSDNSGLNISERFQADVLTYKVIEEGIKKFASCFFNCYINSSILQKYALSPSWKMYVSLYPHKIDGYPTKLMPVEMPKVEDSQEIKPKQPQSSKISICVRPLFNLLENSHLTKLIEFMSYYTSVGVTKFTFYDLSISPQIRKYLTSTSLRKKGINIHLKKWNLPTGNTSELWDFGSIAALNDCLYRNMPIHINLYKNHLFFVDLDEFVVPQSPEHDNLHDLINFYEQSHPSFSQVLVRNTFFCREFCPLNYSLNTCTTRTKRVWNVKLRSKFIVKPQKIIAVGHHMVTKFVDDFLDQRFLTRVKSVEASPQIALLYHYRECGSISTKKHPVLNRLTIKDDRILRFVNKMQFLTN